MLKTVRIIMEILREHVYAGDGKCACGETIGFPEKSGWAVFLVEHQANVVAEALRQANRLNPGSLDQPDRAAEEWLRAYLAEHGPTRWTEVLVDAAVENLTYSKLRKARARLGCIREERVGRGRVSPTWRLP